jgi:Raf kinase inhibitor-like YbhB/YbcL family protein
MMPRSLEQIAVLALALVMGCGRAAVDPGQKDGEGGIPMTIQIASTAFQPGEPIPRKHTGDGEDISPPLSWSGLPGGTKQLALVCDDPDAPRAEPWVHWVIYRLPGNLASLPEGVPNTARLESPAGAMQGRNSWSSGKIIGYRGPAPPPGKVHHYRFRLYALDADLPLDADLDKDLLLKSIEGHVLARGELVGTYERTP